MKDENADALRSEMRQLRDIMQELSDTWFANLDQDADVVREAQAQAQRDVLAYLFPAVYERVKTGSKDGLWGGSRSSGERE